MTHIETHAMTGAPSHYSLLNLSQGITSVLINFVERQNMAVLLEDERRRILFTNPKFCALFAPEASPGELVGADCADAVNHAIQLFADPGAFIGFIQTALRTDRTEVRATLTLKNGGKLKASYRTVHVPSRAMGHLWIYDLQD